MCVIIERYIVYSYIIEKEKWRFLRPQTKKEKN